jgi:hypothetical protein
LKEKPKFSAATNYDIGYKPPLERPWSILCPISVVVLGNLLCRSLSPSPQEGFSQAAPQTLKAHRFVCKATVRIRISFFFFIFLYKTFGDYFSPEN